MKRLIGTLTFVFAISLMSISGQSPKNSNTRTGSEDTITSNRAMDVRAYYFHATRRCATCEAVETVTQEAIKEYYGTKVSFQSINREEDKENPMLAQYKVSGQTLLIIKGDQVVNLTNDAFMNARTNPDKFKAKLKTTVDSML